MLIFVMAAVLTILPLTGTIVTIHDIIKDRAAQRDASV